MGVAPFTSDPLPRGGTKASMVEVREGLLLGSEGDAEAVASGKQRITNSKKRPRVTHVLSISNHPPHWSEPDTPFVGERKEREVEEKRGEEEENEEVEGEGKENEVEDKGGEGEKKNADACKPSKLVTKFIEASDLPSTDLLHHFGECCQFIKQGVERGGVLVHW